MSVVRNLLLAASESAWLREHATRSPVVRRSVNRFMPGERIEDALASAHGLQASGLSTILTHLGENVRDPAEAEAVALHYIELLDRIRASGLDAQISVKPTQ